MPKKCKHKPDGDVLRFEDAWMGCRRSGSYEGERVYQDILCRHCGKHIKATPDLMKWVEC